MIDLTDFRAALVAKDAAMDAAFDAAPANDSGVSAQSFMDLNFPEQAAVDGLFCTLPSLVRQQLSAAMRAMLFGDTVLRQYEFIHPNDMLACGITTAQFDAAVAACASENLVLGDVWL